MKVIWCGHEFPVARAMLSERLGPSFHLESCDPADIVESAAGAEVLIPAMCRIPESAMSEPSLLLIQQFGAGVEGVNLQAARREGVAVANVPTATSKNAVAVAELTLMHLLALARGLFAAREQFEQRQLGVPVGFLVHGKRIACLGKGSVGTAIATLLRAVGAHPIGIGKSIVDAATEDSPWDATYTTREMTEALEGAFALIVSLPLSEETRGIVGQNVLNALPRGAFLLNVGRGAVVDYDALLAALESGQVAGAALDVFWEEPFDPADPIFQWNVQVTPHLGGVSQESYQRMADAVADNIRRVAAGEPLRNVVVSGSRLRRLA